jgi:hypothetical protein
MNEISGTESIHKILQDNKTKRKMYSVPTINTRHSSYFLFVKN